MWVARAASTIVVGCGCVWVLGCLVIAACEEPAPSTTGASVMCGADAECDNGLYCDGVERCIDGRCAAGTAPCEPRLWHEGEDRCATTCATDTLRSLRSFTAPLRRRMLHARVRRRTTRALGYLLLLAGCATDWPTPPIRWESEHFVFRSEREVVDAESSARWFEQHYAFYRELFDVPLADRID